jgi:hypothetical protein
MERLLLIPLLILAGFDAVCGAEAAPPSALKLAPIFGDHMVLQREMPVPIWGTAKPGEKITVTFAGQTKTVTVAEDRKWLGKLDPLKASAEGRVLTVRLDGVSVQGSGVSEPGSKPETRNLTPDTLSVSDVLVGEVRLGSGQSNVVSSANVPQPVAVRYAWSSNRPWANLFNKDGLPAQTFRTDTSEKYQSTVTERKSDEHIQWPRFKFGEPFPTARMRGRDRSAPAIGPVSRAGRPQ